MSEDNTIQTEPMISVPALSIHSLLIAYESYLVMRCEPGDSRMYTQAIADAAGELIRSMPALVQAHGGPLAEHFKDKAKKG